MVCYRRPYRAHALKWGLRQSRSEDQPVCAEPNDDERARALAEVERDYPGWHTWPGVLDDQFQGMDCRDRARAPKISL
jgi:hypothetical protein